MAKNKVEIDVKVDDKGTTKKVGVGAKKAADNLDKVGKGAHSADRQLKGAAQASSNTTKNFSKMSQGISGGLVPAYATLAAQLFAVSAAFNFLKRAGDIVTLQRGQEAFAAATGVAMRSLAKDIVAATDAQIGFQEASQAAAIGIAAGLSPDQLTRLGTAAKQTAAILGRDVTDAFNRLVRGTTKAEPELLDELGIILRLDKATTDYAIAIGKNKNELSAFERTQAVTNDVLAQSEEKFGKIEAAVGLTVNPFNQLGKAFDDIVIKIQEFTAAVAGPLAQVLTDFPVLVGGAFAFFSKGILTAAIPGVAAFGDNLKRVAKEGVRDLEGLQAQSLAANRALAAGLADPEAAAAMGAAARSQLQGSMGAAGITGGVFKIAEGDGPIGNAALGKMRSQLQKMYGDASDIADEALDGMIANIDDLVLQNRVGMGKITGDITDMQEKASLKMRKVEADGKLAFANFSQSAAAGLAKVGMALNLLGIAAVVFSLGAMAFNFIKSKMAGDKLTNTLDAQKVKLEEVRRKVSELNKEYADFNIIQGILGRNRGTSASLAMGNRLASMNQVDLGIALRGEQRGITDETFERQAKAQESLPKLQKREIALARARQQATNKVAEISGLTVGQAIERFGDMDKYANHLKSAENTMTSFVKNYEKNEEKLVKAQEDSRSIQTMLIGDKDSTIGMLVDEQKGFSIEMLQSSKALRDYNKLLNDAKLIQGALTEEEIEALSVGRAKAALQLQNIGQVQRLNKEADKQIDSVKRQLAPQNKYATAITSVTEAIKTATDEQGKALATLSPQEKEKLDRYRDEIELLKELAALEDRRAERRAQLALDNAEIQQRGRGSRGGQNLFASGRRESARRASLATAREARETLVEDLTNAIDLRQIELNKSEEKRDQNVIKRAEQNIKLKTKAIALQDISIQKLKDEGNVMLQFGIQVADTLEGSLANAFRAMIDGSKSASEAMKDFAKNVLASMAQIAANQLAAHILTGLPGLFTGGTAGGGATIQMSQPTMVARRGGLFENAPGYRYGKMRGMSEGGIARGRQAGYPAILHGTEAVVPLPNGNKIPVELKGGTGDQNNIVINISSEGNTTTAGTGSNVAQQKEVGKAISAAVQKELVKQKRPGGLLSPYGAR